MKNKKQKGIVCLIVISKKHLPKRGEGDRNFKSRAQITQLSVL
jgi:hypothetical protein